MCVCVNVSIQHGNPAFFVREREERENNNVSMLDRSAALNTRDVTAEDFGLCPVKHDQYPVAGAEAHAEVGRAPENVGNGTAGCDVAREP